MNPLGGPTVTPSPTRWFSVADQVVVATNAKGSAKTVYHERKDCPGLARAVSTRPVDRSSVAHLDACQLCQDDVERGGGDTAATIHDLLVATDPDELPAEWWAHPERWRGDQHA